MHNHEKGLSILTGNINKIGSRSQNQSKKNLDASALRFDKNGNNVNNNAFMHLVNKSVQKVNEEEESLKLKKNKSERGINIFNQKKTAKNLPQEKSFQNDNRKFHQGESLKNKSKLFIYNYRIRS